MLAWFKGYRTQFFGVLLAVLGVIQQYTREVVPDDWQGLVLMTVGILVVVLREITTTPPRQKE